MLEKLIGPAGVSGMPQLQKLFGKDKNAWDHSDMTDAKDFIERTYKLRASVSEAQRQKFGNNVHMQTLEGGVIKPITSKWSADLEGYINNDVQDKNLKAWLILIGLIKALMSGVALDSHKGSIQQALNELNGPNNPKYFMEETQGAPKTFFGRDGREGAAVKIYSIDPQTNQRVPAPKEVVDKIAMRAAQIAETKGYTEATYGPEIPTTASKLTANPQVKSPLQVEVVGAPKSGPSTPLQSQGQGGPSAPPLPSVGPT
jgi:hypothetical protein